MTEQLANKQQRLAYAQTGREYAERARAVQPGRVEPHYYLALNTAKVAEAGNKLTLIKPMIAIAEAAARIDPRYDEAGAYRFIGKVYLTAPAWPVSVGSPEKAIEFLERAVSISPIAINRLFLGEAYFHDESYAKAKLHIGAALRDGAKLDPRWRQEGESYLRRIRDKDS
jgi:tetratricopeptide (TPR) repeat protein